MSTKYTRTDVMTDNTWCCQLPAQCFVLMQNVIRGPETAMSHATHKFKTQDRHIISDCTFTACPVSVSKYNGSLFSDAG